VLRLAATAAILCSGTVLASGCGLSDEDAPASDSPQLVIETEEDAESQPGAPTFPSTATKNTVRFAGEDAAADAAGVATAVFPATSDSTRPEAVVLVDAEDWQGAVAASVLMAGKIGAPLLVSDGDELPPITAAALGRLDPSGAELADDAQVIRISDQVAEPEGRRSSLVAGTDPYDLAAAIDRFSSSAEGARSGAVVVASGERPEWAMPAGAWAARSGDAVLFTERDALPEATRDALNEHEDPSIYVLGPDSVISEDVEDELGELGSVERIEGPTPVENAIEFARFQGPDFGWGLVTPGHNYTLASTSRPLDAAPAAALATKGTFAPLLLTDDPEVLPDPLEQYFLDVQPGYEDNPNSGVFNRVFLLGDQDTISVAQQSRIDEVTELVPVQIEEGATGTDSGGIPGVDSGGGGGGGGGATDSGGGSAPDGGGGGGGALDGGGASPGGGGGDVPDPGAADGTQ